MLVQLLQAAEVKSLQQLKTSNAELNSKKVIECVTCTTLYHFLGLKVVSLLPLLQISSFMSYMFFGIVYYHSYYNKVKIKNVQIICQVQHQP